LIYLDNAATTKPHQDVLDTFITVNESLYFNPNSPHKAGLQAEQLLQKTKAQIKELFHLKNSFDIVFTSGATESNNIAIKGIAYKKKDFANVIITSVLEHPSVLEVVRSLENEGFNMQKRNGYYLEHLFSKKYQGIKNHYYLIQIGHMISEILESWAQLWEGIRLSIEQKHQKLKDSFKIVRLKEYSGTEKKIQIRLQ